MVLVTSMVNERGILANSITRLCCSVAHTSTDRNRICCERKSQIVCDDAWVSWDEKNGL